MIDNIITLNELLNKVQNYIKGGMQPNPVIVWCDRETIQDPHSFASSISEKHSPLVAFWNWAGSPYTGHNKQIKGGKIVPITDEERYSFAIADVIKFDETGELITKLYVHSPVMCTLGENGLTSIEYGQMIHEKLGLSVILLFPISYRTKFQADMSSYDQFVCKNHSNC